MTIFSRVHAIIQVLLQILSLKYTSIVDQLNLLLPGNQFDLPGHHCIRDIFELDVVDDLRWRDHRVNQWR